MAKRSVLTICWLSLQLIQSAAAKEVVGVRTEMKQNQVATAMRREMRMTNTFAKNLVPCFLKVTEIIIHYHLQ